jgi:hypothetical protein
MCAPRRVVDQITITLVVNGDHIVVDESRTRSGGTEEEPISSGAGRFAGARGALRITYTRSEARYQFNFVGRASASALRAAGRHRIALRRLVARDEWHGFGSGCSAGAG